MILQCINWLTMLFTIFFQAPIFPCPYLPCQRNVLSVSECFNTRNLNLQMDGGNSLHYPHYYFIVTSIGLEKNPSGYLPTLKAFMMGMLFLLLTLQKNLWESDFYKTKILEELNNFQENKVLRAIRFIQFHFEKKFWKYTKNRVMRQIHLHRFSSLEEKLKTIEIPSQHETLVPSMRFQNQTYSNDSQESNPFRTIIRNLTIHLRQYNSSRFVNQVRHSQSRPQDQRGSREYIPIVEERSQDEEDLLIDSSHRPSPERLHARPTSSQPEDMPSFLQPKHYLSNRVLLLSSDRNNTRETMFRSRDPIKTFFEKNKSNIETTAENFVLSLSDHEPILSPNDVVNIIKNSIMEEFSKSEDEVEVELPDNLLGLSDMDALNKEIMTRIRSAQKAESKRLQADVLKVEELRLKELQPFEFQAKVDRIKWVIFSYLDEIDHTLDQTDFFIEFSPPEKSPIENPLKQAPRVLAWVKKLYHFLKRQLLTSTNLLFRSFHGTLLTSQTDLPSSRTGLLTSRTNLLTLVLAFLHSWSLVLVVLVFLVSLLANACFLTVPPILMLLLFGLLHHPFAPSLFWKLIIFYQMLVIIVKLGYHLPLFCLHKFTLAFSENCYSLRSSVSSSFLLSPEFLGLTKPGVNNMIQFLCFDVLSLLVLLFHRATLVKMGVWEFVSLDLGRLNRRLARVPPLRHRHVPQDLPRLAATHGLLFEAALARLFLSTPLF